MYTCLLYTSILSAVSAHAFAWLLAGGIAYTIGAVIYALKPKLLASKSFGNHEIFPVSYTHLDVYKRQL